MSDATSPSKENREPDDRRRRSADALPEKWVRTPPIDIFETEDGLVLRADLPGVTLENLELQVQDNRLTLFGRVETVVPEGASLLHQEYQVGDYLRSFILSDDVDHDRISAKLNDGVLEVVLPKIPRSQPRKIQIQTDRPS
ncbi:MAG: Hsp20/alpha crystallin family protein [Planctomycetaceae bacterium]|nr:Hsp20/alpha crystallin family protein [Planctomycetaceae bacterium]